MIKEFQIRLDDYKRPLLVVKNTHNIQKLHDVSEKYNNPQKIVDTLQEAFEVSTLAEEYVWLLTTASNGAITGIFEVSHGSVDRSLFPVREIIQSSLLAGAVNIIIAHCHPSGSAEPSDEDITVTKRLYEACKVMGLHFLDHIIMGCEFPVVYYSFNENEIMKGW